MTRNATWHLAIAAILLPATVLAGGVKVIGVTGNPGSTVPVSVQLTGDELIAGTQNDIRFNPNQLSVAAVASNGNKPDCQVNPNINKKIDGSETFGFGFLKGTSPAQACDPTGVEKCDGIRAIVVSTDNVEPITTGATLFTCQFKIDGGVAAGTQLELTVENQIGSDPVGQRIAVFTGEGANIVVGNGGGTCVGDCGTDSIVDIQDLQKGLDIYFGAAVSTCPSFDSNPTDGIVDIGELQIGLDHYFGGCP